MLPAPPATLFQRSGRRVAAGVLSWKSDRTLENTLADHRQRGLFELFDDFVIHFQEVRPTDIERAERYGLRWIGSPHNRHIGGGFHHLLKNLDADYVLLLEDDLTLAVPADQLAATLHGAITLMEAGEADEFLCRRDDMLRSGYEKFFPITQLDRAHIANAASLRRGGSGLGRWLRRSLHPAQAEKHLGKVVWFEAHPDIARPDVVRKASAAGLDYYIVQGAATKWAHPAVFASRAHLLQVFGHVSSQLPGFDDFGKCLESLINDGPFRTWWLAQNYRIAHTKPVLTLHDRHADGGKLASGAR